MGYREQKEIIRGLCQELLEASQTEANSLRREAWRARNALAPGAPLLWICPDDDGGWLELVGGDLACEDKDLRMMELQLRKQVYHSRHFFDDFVFEPVLRLDIPGEYTGYHYGKPGPQKAWGIDLDARQAGPGAYRLDCRLDYGRDWESFSSSEADFIEDSAVLSELREKLEEAAHPLIQIQFAVPYIVLVQSLLIEFVHLRGLEELMLDLADNPELLHKALSHMARSKAALLDRLEREGRLTDNRSNIYTGSGGLGYLPGSPSVPQEGFAKLSHMWGFADAQELSLVSPRMFEEFALAIQADGLNRFGYACYGCCEPVDRKVEMIFKRVPNIRRISVSPWSDPEMAAESIGRRAIYSWKPNPAEICMGFCEDDMRMKLRKMAKTTKGCVMETILKDIRTVGGRPDRLALFAKIAKEELG